MNITELTQEELHGINGGNNGSSSAGIGLTISTSSLLSLDYNWSNGNDQSYQSNLTVGKDIETGAGIGQNSFHS